MIDFIVLYQFNGLLCVYSCKGFYKKDFQDVKIAAKYWREVLLNLMNKSPQHKAAIKRIASTITGDGIERLKPFLK
ncbi:hypothetical protein [Acinetobacter baumannii]|uniref:hypothetical protein n=1 Tax=Acinetobacter baumannii TaxID=470 RepID=UPI0035D0109B